MGDTVRDGEGDTVGDTVRDGEGDTVGDTVRDGEGDTVRDGEKDTHLRHRRCPLSHPPAGVARRCGSRTAAGSPALTQVATHPAHAARVRLQPPPSQREVLVRHRHPAGDDHAAHHDQRELVDQ